MGWYMPHKTRDLVPDSDHWRRDYTPEMYGEANRYDHDRERWHWGIMRLVDGHWRSTLAGVIGTMEEAMWHADKIGEWYESQFHGDEGRILVGAGSREYARGSHAEPVRN